MAAPHASTPQAAARPPADAGGERPAARLFVVQLGEGRACRGQVEHVLSGRRQAFATTDGLLAALGLDARDPAA